MPSEHPVPRRSLDGAYGSVADPDGIALYGSASSLQALATAIRAEDPAEFVLATPPDEIVEARRLDVIRIRVERDRAVELRVNEGAVEIVGAPASLSKLAATLENLAEEDPFLGIVSRHVDIEHFPGHAWLAQESSWMTVTLLAVPE